MTIKEIENVFRQGEITEEFIESCRSDSRKSVQTILRRYEREKRERERLHTMYMYERIAAQAGRTIVAGVDEAGRGPLAGPVSVAAVVLPLDYHLPRLNDSKKLSHVVREELFAQIMDAAVSYHVALVDSETIDRMNILQATRMGMYEAIARLSPAPKEVLIDAVELPKLPMPSQFIIKGDAKSASIAAASILAKVTRDRLMEDYDREYPNYGFAQHKGYGTREHIDAIRKYGVCPIHRKSFEPIRSMLNLSVIP
jgi:ribonuclease HII